MELKDIKDVVTRHVKIISDVLGVNVTVIDRNLCRISSVRPSFEEPEEVRWDSIVGTVISTGQPLAVDNPSKYAPCKRCPDFHSCRMDGVIAVPIICQGEILGAFYVVVPRSQGNLFQKLNSSIGFLENMAGLLSEKLISYVPIKHWMIFDRNRRWLSILLMMRLHSQIYPVKSIIATKNFKCYLTRGRIFKGRASHL